MFVQACGTLHRLLSCCWDETSQRRLLTEESWLDLKFQPDKSGIWQIGVWQQELLLGQQVLSCKQEAGRLWKLTACSQWHPSSSEATPPKLIQTMPPNRNQVFKFWVHRGYSHSNHHVSILWKFLNLFYRCVLQAGGMGVGECWLGGLETGLCLESKFCLCRGPEFNPQHPCQVDHSSRAPAFCALIHTCTHIHAYAQSCTHTLKCF